MKIVFLSRYQNTIERGAEIFVKELSSRMSKNHKVDVFTGEKADSLRDVLKGHYNLVIPVNGRLQSLKFSLGRIIGKYKLLISGHSGVGRDDIWNIVIKPDVFVALSDFAAHWAKKYAWGSKVVKIPNGIDLDKFSPNGEKINIDLPRPIILSVGALVWYKHHEKVIDAVSKMETASVLIVGEGLLKEELKKRGEEKLGKRFMVVSFKNEDMPKVYRTCDLFTLPSWDREAFGIVYLEAMASGLGVVAPDDFSRREIIGDAGLFVNVEDIDTYAYFIRKALDVDWEDRPRKQAEKFSWEKISGQYEKLLLYLR